MSTLSQYSHRISIVIHYSLSTSGKPSQAMNQDYAVKKAARCICWLPASLGAQAGQHTDNEAAKIKRA